MRSRYLVVLLVGVLSAAFLAAAGSAGASATGVPWEPFVTPNPLTATGFLNAVSCGTAGHCVAVGYYADGQGDVVPLAEVSTGAGWSLVPPVTPSGAGLSVLNAISCQPDGSCEAAGYYTDASSNVHAFAERFSGGSWALQLVVAPVGARDAGLLGLECQSATSCFAVGNYTDASGDSLVLGEKWTGAAWSPQYVPSPGPSVAVASQLDAISCTTAGCTAVGSYHTADGRNVPLTEARTSTSWQVQLAMEPTGSVAANLLGVSCDAAAVCLAVGYWTDDMGNESALALHRSSPSATWTLTSAPPSGTAQSPSLAAVSCVTQSDCTAVGSASLGTLIEHWTGNAWVHQPSGAPQRSAGTGISCPAPAACVVAGYALTGNKIPVPLLDSDTGGGWQVAAGVPAPGGAVTAGLSAVSCSSPGLCTAVGDQTSVRGLVTSALVERLAGGVWTTQSVVGASSLVGVTCSDDSHCVAAGYLGGRGITSSVVESWTGTVWKSVVLPQLAGSTESDLRAVSCASATSCLAVGEYSDASGNPRALAAELSDGQWQLLPVPLPAGTADATLTGVSCVGSRCTVVGNGSTTHGQPRLLIEVWNGTAWTIQHAAVPTGAIQVQLQAVSCAAASTCTLVGSWLGGAQGDQYSLVEQRTGVSWAVVPTPNPAGVVSSPLQAVSCAVAGCAAVGYDYAIGPNGLPAPATSFAETSAGAMWSAQPVDVPAGTNSSALAGVSCSGGQCVAVGYRFASSGRMVTLAVGG